MASSKMRCLDGLSWRGLDDDRVAAAAATAPARVDPSRHGHHGGAWKVAYADFVTAMMAFFLVMWIVGQSRQDEGGRCRLFP
jgi:Membrane MotB of proton-channel complex MotA/MotB